MCDLVVFHCCEVIARFVGKYGGSVTLAEEKRLRGFKGGLLLDNCASYLITRTRQECGVLNMRIVSDLQFLVWFRKREKVKWFSFAIDRAHECSVLGAEVLVMD